MQLQETDSIETILVRLESADAALLRAQLAEDGHAAVYLIQSAQSDLVSLTLYYADHPRLDYEFEQRLILGIDTYFRVARVAIASELNKTSVDANAMQLRIPLLTLHMQTLAQVVRWTYLRYETLSEAFWQEVHEAYKQAEGFMPTFKLLEANYLHILALDSANPSSLSKVEIIGLDKWLSWASQEVVLSKESNAQQVFYIDLDLPRGPKRKRDPMPSGNLRYWSMRAVTQRLLHMRTELQMGLMPENFLPGVSRSRMQVILDLLLNAWAEHTQRQRRAAERQLVSKWANAVNGFMYVCQHIKNADFSKHSQADALVQPNSWLIQNESPVGLGAIVDSELNAWVRPGTLVALEYLLNPDIPILAVVRSLHKSEGRELHVGLEVVSYTPVYVRIQFESEGQVGDESSTPALYLARNETISQSASLVLPVLPSRPHALVHLQAEGLHYQARLSGIQEQQEEWMRVTVHLESELTA